MFTLDSNQTERDLDGLIQIILTLMLPRLGFILDWTAVDLTI